MKGRCGESAVRLAAMFRKALRAAERLRAKRTLPGLACEAFARFPGSVRQLVLSVSSKARLGQIAARLLPENGA